MRFWQFVRRFALTGLAVPVCFIMYWFVFKGTGDSLYWLWPASIQFMGLDGPAPEPTSTVVVVYTVAIFENILVYSVVGALLWVSIKAVRRGLRAFRSASR